MGSIWQFLKVVVSPAVSLFLIPYLKTKVIVDDDDQRRYDLIAGIAKEAADEAVLRLPGEGVDDIIQMVVDQIRGSVPTTKEEVIYRAGAAAVRRAVRQYRDEPQP